MYDSRETSAQVFVIPIPPTDVPRSVYLLVDSSTVDYLTLLYYAGNLITSTRVTNSMFYFGPVLAMCRVQGSHRSPRTVCRVARSGAVFRPILVPHNC